MARRRGKINKAVFKRQLKNGVIKSKKTKAFVYQRAKVDFERKKRKLVSDFDNHDITREIAAGPNASNKSGTLGGYGNLYSFIGFDRGSDPISPVRAMLLSHTKLLKKSTVKTTKGNIVYQFSVRYPSKDLLASVAPMPWEPGSWLLKIERGISGLGYYIYGRHLENSRSGSGIQSGSKVNTGLLFKRTSYISLILRTFEKNLR